MLLNVPSPTAVDFHPPVEGRPHRIQIDELVGVKYCPVDFHIEPSMCVSQMNELLWVLSIMAVQVVVAELKHQPPAEECLHLRAAQLAMQPLGQEQCDVVQRNTRLAKLLNDNLDGSLSEVRALRPKVCPRRVIKRNDDLRLAVHQLLQRLVSDRAVDDLANALSDIRNGGQGVLPLDDASALWQGGAYVAVPICDLVCTRVLGMGICSFPSVMRPIF